MLPLPNQPSWMSQKSAVVVLVPSCALADYACARRWPDHAPGRMILGAGLAAAVLLPMLAFGYGRWRLGEGDLLPGPRLTLIQGNTRPKSSVSHGTTSHASRLFTT